LAQTELTIEVIHDILDENCHAGVYEKLMTQTPLAGVKDKVSVKKFFEIVNGFKFHWTDSTPRRIEDVTRKLIKDGNMKTITLQVEDVDQVIVDELKDAYLRNNKFDRVDCSDTVLEPDYELLKAIQTVLEYYMTAEELELWNNYEKNNPHQS
jgi:hypothetical protein